MNPYTRFAAMIATSTVAMFGLMYLNTYSADHLFFSETRAYMAIVMGATMAVVMLMFMTHMMKSRGANVAIAIGRSRRLLSRCGSCAARPRWKKCRG